MGCLDNIPHPKPTKHGTYKHQKCGTARLSAPADTPAEAADPTVARTRSSTATAACGAPHGAEFLSARTTNALLTAASSDHHSARTDPATTARRRTGDRQPSAHRPPSRAAAPAGRTTIRCLWQQRTRAEAEMAAKPSLATSRPAQPERHAKPCGSPCGHACAGASTVRRGARKRRALAAASVTCDGACEQMKSAPSVEPSGSGWDAG